MTTSSLSSAELSELVNSLADPNTPEWKRREIRRYAKSLPTWIPFRNRPQETAYSSPADEIYFGGAAGAGKTGLGVGLALTQHRRSLILRRESTNAIEIVDQLREFAPPGSRWKSSGYGGKLTTPDGRTVEVAGCPHEEDKSKYQGRPHDLIVFDEAPTFSRSQVRFISAWNRHENPAQRCRILLPGNPPTRPEDRWIIEEFAPWLDAEYPRPAGFGEVRWFTVIDDKVIWVDGPQPFLHQGEVIQPRSRTFIPGKLSDNPILAATNYASVLQALREPLRSQLLYGDMNAGTEDDAWQVIPTAWVRAAQRRWTEKPPVDTPQTSIGVDVARGGRDKTTLARRHKNWFAKLLKYAGVDTPDGPSVETKVMRAHEGDSTVLVDVIGVGASAYDFIKQHTWFRTVPVNGSEASSLRDRSGKFGFLNVRAAAYWKFAEALNPDSGEDIALPPDSELLADLCAPRYEVKSNGIKIESKPDIIERIGRSPDCGDAVVYSWWSEVSARPPQGIRVFTSRVPLQKGKLQIVVCSPEELQGLTVEGKALLLTFTAPCGRPDNSVRQTNEPVTGSEVRHVSPIPPSDLVSGGGVGSDPPAAGHRIQQLLGSISLSLADVKPEDIQQSWGVPIPPWNLPAQDLVMKPEDGKRLWAFLLRKRTPAADVWVLCGPDGLALTAAYALADTLRLPRDQTIYLPRDPELKTDKRPPPNHHVYSVMRSARSLVL
jgi:hypothetical protein